MCVCVCVCVCVKHFSQGILHSDPMQQARKWYSDLRQKRRSKYNSVNFDVYYARIKQWLQLLKISLKGNSLINKQIMGTFVIIFTFIHIITKTDYSI